MSKVYSILISLFTVIFMSAAQITEQGNSTFSPSGKPIVTVFSDFSNANSNGKSKNAFEVSRAYFGYGYNFSRDFSGKILFSFEDNAGLGSTAYSMYLKNAYIEYVNSILKIDFGMVDENMFDLQKSFWGKRYIYKSFQNQYGFGLSADLGAKVQVQILPQMSFDISLLNGEGYRKVQEDSTMLLAIGLTANPIKNLFLRIYFDYLNKSNTAVTTNTANQQSFNFFCGYRGKIGSLGAEFNLQQNHANLLKHDFGGISLYGTIPVGRNLSVFARFDDLMSEKIGTATSGWNSTDGQVYMAGIELAPVKGVLVSPNIRYSYFTTKSSITTLSLNIRMGF